MIRYFLPDRNERRRTVTLPTLLVVFVIISFPGSATEAADAVKSGERSKDQIIIGRWVRPDGGYILEFKEIGKDGVLKAAYFNPNPIHVYRAKLQDNKGQITVSVELRDVNYPGSTYNLLYDPKTDRLIGTYFQAVEGVTYEIEFMRSN